MWQYFGGPECFIFISQRFGGNIFVVFQNVGVFEMITCLAQRLRGNTLVVFNVYSP